MTGATPARGHRLAFERLTKVYGDTIAVDEVTLTIEPGTFFSLLGPSGSGKTTVLMILAGFTKPTSGCVLLDGRSINDVPPEKRNFGMVFQGYALFPHQTVGENVAFPLAVRGINRAERARRVAAALDLVQLSALRDRYPKQISGGQQQRVALARALVFEPSVILLDEPLSALDRKLRMSLQWELRDLHRRLGKTFICVTHDQEEALSMSDEIAIIKGGRIIQKGNPTELYERPVSHFVADFLGENNFFEGSVIATDTTGFDYAVGSMRFRQHGAAGISGHGDKVLIALRSNKLTAQTTDPSKPCNRVEGRIRQWSYRGGELSLKVETAIGMISVGQPTWPVPLAPEIGKHVWVVWSPAATVAISDDRKMF